MTLTLGILVPIGGTGLKGDVYQRITALLKLFEK